METVINTSGEELLTQIAAANARIAQLEDRLAAAVH